MEEVVTEMMFLDDIYQVKQNDNGTKTMQCSKNKRGFKITIHLGGTDEQKQQAEQAIEKFYINNLL